MDKYCGYCGTILDEKTKLCKNNCIVNPILPKDKKTIKQNTSKKKKNIKTAIICASIIASIVIAITAIIMFVNNKKPTESIYYNSNYIYFTEDFTDIAITDEKSLIKAIASVGEKLGIKNPESELKINKFQSSDNCNYYKVQQCYNNIPVYNKYISVVSSTEGRALALTSNYFPISEKISTTPSISANEIQKAICNYLQIESINIDSLTKEMLVIFIKNETTPILAYNISINGLCNLIIDADTADVLSYKTNCSANSAEVYSETNKDIKTTGYKNDDGTYSLFNKDYNIEVFDFNGQSSKDPKINGIHPDYRSYGLSTITSKTNKFNNNAVLLLSKVIDIYDFFIDLGFEKLDKYSIGINDSRDNGENAFGGGSYFNDKSYGVMSVGTQFNYNCVDVIAHEFTHTVTRIMVDFKKGIEGDAVSEGYSDLFGILFENSSSPDWNIHHMNSLLRDIRNPSLTGGYTNTSQIGQNKDENPYTLSTIVSHAAYNMWDGNNGSTAKINSEKLAKLWYQALLLMNADVDFSILRNAVELSANIMVLNKELSPTEYISVCTAFDNAGIEKTPIMYSKTVKSEFDFIVLNHEKNKRISYALRIYKMPEVNLGSSPFITLPELLHSQTINNGKTTLKLNEGKYCFYISESNSTSSAEISILIEVKNDIHSLEELTIYTDFQASKINKTETNTPSEEHDTINLTTIPQNPPEILTIENIKKIFLQANNLSIGWLIHGLTPKFDDTSTIVLGDHTYKKVITGEYSSINELDQAFRKFFVEEAYINKLKTYYVDYDNSLYGTLGLGQGGEATPEKAVLEIISLSDNECIFSITTYYPYDESQSTYHLKLIDGEWLFDELLYEFSLYLYPSLLQIKN